MFEKSIVNSKYCLFLHQKSKQSKTKNQKKMKKAINQKVETSSKTSFSYVIAITRKSKTFCFNYQDYQSAFDAYFERVQEEARFTSLINSKTIIGLYDVTEYGQTIKIVKQTKVESNKFY
jgi:hypothetical protein